MPSLRPRHAGRSEIPMCADLLCGSMSHSSVSPASPPVASSTMEKTAASPSWDAPAAPAAQNGDAGPLGMGTHGRESALTRVSTSSYSSACRILHRREGGPGARSAHRAACADSSARPSRREGPVRGFLTTSPGRCSRPMCRSGPPVPLMIESRPPEPLIHRPNRSPRRGVTTSNVRYIRAIRGCPGFSSESTEEAVSGVRSSGIMQIRAFSRSLGSPNSGDRGSPAVAGSSDLGLAAVGERRWVVAEAELPPALCWTHAAGSDAGLLGKRRGRVLGGSGWSGADWEPGRPS